MLAQDPVLEVTCQPNSCLGVVLFPIPVFLSPVKLALIDPVVGGEPTFSLVEAIFQEPDVLLIKFLNVKLSCLAAFLK